MYSSATYNGIFPGERPITSSYNDLGLGKLFRALSKSLLFWASQQKSRASQTAPRAQVAAGTNDPRVKQPTTMLDIWQGNYAFADDTPRQTFYVTLKEAGQKILRERLDLDAYKAELQEELEAGKRATIRRVVIMAAKDSAAAHSTESRLALHKEWLRIIKCLDARMNATNKQITIAANKLKWNAARTITAPVVAEARDIVIRGFVRHSPVVVVQAAAATVTALDIICTGLWNCAKILKGVVRPTLDKSSPEYARAMNL